VILLNKNKPPVVKVNVPSIGTAFFICSFKLSVVTMYVAQFNKIAKKAEMPIKKIPFVRYV
jgi:hypothetical protein